MENPFEPFLISQCTARNLSLTNADLRKIRLDNLRADGLNFEEADFRESILVNAKWKGCILRDARLDDADLTDAVFRLCDFDQVRATDAKLIRTRLENSTARGAQFDRTDLTEATLTDTDFSRASFRSANLEGISASGASFRGADLSGAKLQNADLTDADLRGADLTDADIEGADLDGADLRGAIGIEALQEESCIETLPEELKPLVGTVAPLVDEMLRSAGQTGFLDPEVVDQLKKQMDDIQSTHPSRSIHPDTLKAVSEVIESLSDEAFPSLLAALGQPNEGDPPPEVQALIRRLGQALNLGNSASPDEILAKLTNTESSENPDPKPDT